MGREHWPLFDLRVTTPRVELRYPSDDDLFALVDLARQGVHDPNTMPFAVPWTDPAPDRERSTLQYHWEQRTRFRPDDWTCNFVVVSDGQLVGSQSISATQFVRLRQVATGSWLGLAHQGQGIGTEMRAAVLHFAFAGLGAEYALSAAWTDNEGSLGVSRRLGYREVGTTRALRRDEPDWQLNLRLDRATWEAARRDDIAIEGLDACSDWFGA